MKLTARDLFLFPGQRIPDQFLARKSQTKGENATAMRVSGQVSVRILLPQFTTENFLLPISHKKFRGSQASPELASSTGRPEQVASMETVFNHSEASQNAQNCALYTAAQRMKLVRKWWTESMQILIKQL
jgi:hypothetical protein